MKKIFLIVLGVVLLSTGVSITAVFASEDSGTVNSGTLQTLSGAGFEAELGAEINNLLNQYTGCIEFTSAGCVKLSKEYIIRSYAVYRQRGISQSVALTSLRKQIKEKSETITHRRGGRVKYADITLNKPPVVDNDLSEADNVESKAVSKSGDANHNTVRSNNTNGIIVKGAGAIKNITRTESDTSRKMDDVDVHEEIGAKKMDKGVELNGNIHVSGDVRRVDRNKDGHVTGNITLSKGHSKAVEKIISNITSDAWEPLKTAEVEDVIDETEDGEAVIFVERVVEEKLFGIFSVNIKEVAKATVKGVSEVKRPWWSVFAW